MLALASGVLRLAFYVLLHGGFPDLRIHRAPPDECPRTSLCHWTLTGIQRRNIPSILLSSWSSGCCALNGENSLFTRRAWKISLLDCRFCLRLGVFASFLPYCFRSWCLLCLGVSWLLEQAIGHVGNSVRSGVLAQVVLCLRTRVLCYRKESATIASAV